MNFKKLEGSKVLDIEEILAKHYQKDLELILIAKGKLNREFEEDGGNRTAYITVDGKRYVNQTYSFGAKSLESIDSGLKIFIKEFIDNLPDRCWVSFRKPFSVDYEDSKYTVTMRCAVVDGKGE